MGTKFIIQKPFITGWLDIAKGNLYQLVPLTDDSRAINGVPFHHELTQPLYGTVAGNATTGMLLEEMLGKNVIVPLALRAGGAKEEPLYIPEAIVSITKKKTIVSTVIVGGKGTVKEFISDNDMEIDITVGIVSVDDNNIILDEYPAEDLYKLMNILDSHKGIEAWSPFLELFDLDGGYFKMVITEYKITQSTHTNRQSVNIRAVSDYDYTIFYEES
jgi:hypothetical protein